MTLLEWLKQQPGTTVRALAQNLGETESTVSKWVYGQRQPTLQNAVKIEDFTKGQVRAREMVRPAKNSPTQSV